jgi:hypothetical protein
MVGLAANPPAGRVPDMGGPQIKAIKDLARAYLVHAGKRRPIISLPFPGAAFRAMREGHNVVPDHADGRITFEEYLSRKSTVQ